MLVLPISRDNLLNKQDHRVLLIQSEQAAVRVGQDRKMMILKSCSSRTIIAVTLSMVYAALNGLTASWAQDTSYPYPPMNPYVPVSPPIAPKEGPGSSLPWPYNPLGTPMAPLPSQTLPPGQVPTPGIYPPPNFIPPTPLPSEAASSPWGQSTAPGFTPEPPTSQPLPVSTTPSAAPGGFPQSGMSPEAAGGEKHAGEAGKKAEGEGGTEQAAGEGANEEKKAEGEEGAEEKKAQGKKKKSQDGSEKEAKEGKKSDGKEGEEGKEEESKKDLLPPAAPVYDPIREALFELNSKQYSRSLETLNKVLSSNPHHAQAHYVRAIVLVMMRQYTGAAADYKEVLRLTPNSDLGRRAAEGLKKISL